MKKAAQAISYLFHPFLMPSVGLLLLLNSGTYLSLLDPAAKRAILYVMLLGTLIFPIIILPVLYYRKYVTGHQQSFGEEKTITTVVVLILYILTFIYFVKLPLSRVIHAYVLSVSITLFLGILLNLRFRLSFHTAALGGITGLIIALIILFEIPLEFILMLTLLAGGITGSARLAAGNYRSGAVYAGFLLGFGTVLITLLVY